MPIRIQQGSPSVLIRRDRFERTQLSRTDLDRLLNLTPEEFAVEGELISVGPIVDAEGIEVIVRELEGAGLVYFEDFFDLSGNWPDWLQLFAMSRRAKEADVSSDR
ncbi:MAG: hypothetical protein ACT4OZ_06545 [Gemmatimonadota bacterium]